MNSHVEHAREQLGSAVKDPVCGMDVDPATSEHHLEHDGRKFYFCSGPCRARFEASPEAYLSPHGDSLRAHQHHHSADHQDGATAATPGQATEWTCPMHPEIRRPGPGPCPICGMAL